MKKLWRKIRSNPHVCGGKIKGFCIWSHHWNEVFQGERFYYELMFYYCERIMIHISKHKNEKETCTLMWILICLVICNTTLLIDILPLKLLFSFDTPKRDAFWSLFTIWYRWKPNFTYLTRKNFNLLQGHILVV